MGTDVSLHAGVPQDQVSKKYWRTLLYGLSGAGKTRTASIWPKPLFFDFDHGLGSIDRKIAWVRMSSWDDWNGWAEKLMKKVYPVGTLVIDSVPAMQRAAMESSVHKFGAKRAHGDIPGQSDYGKMFWDVWRSISELFDLPYHLVVIGQCQWGEFGEQHKPMFIGQAIHEPLLQAMDLVGFIEKTGERETRLSFGRSDAVTKDRFGFFGDTVFINPTWEDLEGRVKKPPKVKKEPEIQEGVPAE